MARVDSNYIIHHPIDNHHIQAGYNRTKLPDEDKFVVDTIRVE